MGIHIIPRIVHEKIQLTATDCYGKPFAYYRATEYTGFDGLRHSGDKDFINTDQIEWTSLIDEEPDGYWYSRPVDFEAAIQWIKENIPDCNQARLLKLMDDMQADERLYIYVSH